MASRKRWWICPSCGRRNERVKQKCATEGCGRSRPKARVPKHALTLQSDSYEHYDHMNELIHGVTDESCAVCRKPRSQEMRHHRDHGHLKDSLTFGKPRGLACVECNILMPVKLTAERARLIAEYLCRADNHYRKELT